MSAWVRIVWRYKRMQSSVPTHALACTPNYREIERYVERTCKGEYETPLLARVGAWKDAVLVPWLRGLMLPPTAPVAGTGHADAGNDDGEEEEEEEGMDPKAQAAARRAFHEWQLRHGFSVYEAFARVRIGEMFDIIREYPDSLPAVRVSA